LGHAASDALLISSRSLWSTRCAGTLVARRWRRIRRYRSISRQSRIC
jgi:hypothetical protein